MTPRKYGKDVPAALPDAAPDIGIAPGSGLPLAAILMSSPNAHLILRHALSGRVGGVRSPRSKARLFLFGLYETPPQRFCQ